MSGRRALLNVSRSLRPILQLMDLLSILALPTFHSVNLAKDSIHALQTNAFRLRQDNDNGDQS
jgi:hypothetical protein